MAICDGGVDPGATPGATALGEIPGSRMQCRSARQGGASLRYMYVRFLSDMPTARRGANQECREDEDLSRSKTIFGGEQHACGNVERGSFGGSHSSHSLWRMTARTMHMRKRKLIRARKLIRRDARVCTLCSFRGR